MQSIIGNIFFAAFLGSQLEQQNLMDLDDSEDKDGLRGHKTVRATTFLAQIAFVVFLCCLTICYQENTKCCSLCAKVLQDFLRRFTKISKRDKKEAEEKTRKIAELFSPNHLCGEKCHRKLYILKISASSVSCE